MIQTFKKLFSKPPSGENFYEIIGRDKGIEELVANFYDCMEKDPKARECLAVHKLHNGKVPEETKQKLIFFLTGWMGGPNLFVEKFGPPKMRARHLHIPIPPELAVQWLYCMEKAINQLHRRLSKEQKKNLLSSFQALAIRIINTELPT